MSRYDREIPPGGEGTIRVEVNLLSCQGSVRKTTLVMTNDPVTPSFELVMSGTNRP
ncbi:MAG: hypothetical protein GX443_09995 [Deltaproteobacteria bacterium]|nr:hypothetical protein [Deltaproteobacteria bacterium]